MKTRRAARFGASLSVTVVCFCLFGAEGSMSYRFVLKWGSWGSSDGQFRRAYSVAVHPSGTVVVPDGNNRIQKFDSEGKLLTKWGSEGSGDGEFDKPSGVAVDSKGNVFVADRYNHRIQKFRRDPGIRIIGPADSPIIQWHSEAGRSYKVWLSGDLFDWITAGGIQPGSGINLCMDDGLHELGPPSVSNHRYYRVEQLK